MAKKGFLDKLVSKEALWALGGGAAAWGGYYLVGKLVPDLVSSPSQNTATVKQIAVAGAVGLGGALLASRFDAPDGVALGMAGMAGTVAATAALVWFRARQGQVAGLGSLGLPPGPMPMLPRSSYVSYGGDGMQGLPGLGLSSMPGVAEVRVRDNPNFVPRLPSQSAALRRWW